MKLKVLLIPVIIVAIVAIFIGLVYPTYSNGVDGVKENYLKLNDEKAKLAEIKNENKNINSLSTQLASLSTKSTLYTFLPETVKEEGVINALSSTAISSGVLLLDINIKQTAKKDVTSEELNFEKTFKTDSLKTSKVLPKPDNFEASVKFIGDYGKVKTFLANLGKLSINNNFKILKIDRNNSKNEENPNADSLLVDASIEFNFLERKDVDESSIGNSVFSSSSLDTNIIDEIDEKKNNNNFQLNIEGKGKNNLFQP